jgi:MoaA/NifB/PqqE/SkfB family radical SAM enzyme
MCLVSFSKEKEYTAKTKVVSKGLTWAVVDATSKCSHGCAWCYGGFNEEGTGVHVSVENFKITLSKLKDMGIKQVTITGGEPTENPNILEMVGLATKDFMVHVNTHGDWNRNYAKDFARLGVSQIQFNYQGSKRHDNVHQVLGAYIKQVTAIKQSLKAGLETVGTLTVGAYNLKDVDIIFKEMSDLGIERLRVWEATGKGNKWRKDKEAIEIFNICKDVANNLGFNFVQSYDPNFEGDVGVKCIPLSKVGVYIDAKSNLIFCPATEQLLDKPIASFLTDSAKTITTNFNNFVDKELKKGFRCLAREAV